MSRKTILIVEDDKNITKLVKYNLEKAGYQCLTTIIGEDALNLIQTRVVDLVILDIMLPKMDGLEVCRIIKTDEEHKHIPIVMLTAKGEEVDRVVGFELGADDYVVKPFSPRELVLRVKSLLKRQSDAEPEPALLSVPGLSVDIGRHKVIADEKPVKLTLMEFNLLATLMKRQGRVQSREALLEEVWQMGADVTTRTVDTHIKRLRQKLGKAGGMVETVRGIGYRFSEEM